MLYYKSESMTVFPCLHGSDQAHISGRKMNQTMIFLSKLFTRKLYSAEMRDFLCFLRFWLLSEKTKKSCIIKSKNLASKNQNSFWRQKIKKILRQKKKQKKINPEKFVARNFELQKKNTLYDNNVIFLVSRTQKSGDVLCVYFAGPT